MQRLDIERRRELGSRLRSLRLDRNLSREQLAELAAIHPTYVEKIESGKQVPSLDVLLRVSSALDAPISYVLAVLEEKTGQAQETLTNEVTALIRHLDPRHLVFLRDFIQLLRKHQ